MTAYYNENDPKAAAWLRELIRQGLIAKGEVDERSIVDVRPSELKGFTQCHFFAGIGVWSYALRRAGWSDNMPAWTGSCPCQPFSGAGKGSGFDDERHLWPHFHWLIDQCRPERVFGEQVASKDGLGWLDLVQADLEGSGYASGAVDTCSAGFGAPHIRQRLWWVAERMGHAASGGRGEFWNAPWAGCGGHIDGAGDPFSGLEHAGNIRSQGRLSRWPDTERGIINGSTGRDSATIGVEHADSGQSSSVARDAGEVRRIQKTERQSEHGTALHVRGSGTFGMADSECRECPTGRRGNIGEEIPQLEIRADVDGHREVSRPYDLIGAASPTNGIWRNADWLFCRDGKWRPVEPGTFPLAHGAPARVGRLRGYGNAINAEAATAFIEAYLEAGAIAA